MLGNVMLIDDDPFCNRMNSFVLEQQNAAENILTYLNALDALEYLQGLVMDENHDAFPDIILLDLHMTYMDGWDFLKKYRTLSASYKKKTSIYILTSSIQASDREAAAEQPEVRGYIEKPFTTDELNYIIADQETRVEK